MLDPIVLDARMWGLGILAIQGLLGVLVTLVLWLMKGLRDTLQRHSDALNHLAQVLVGEYMKREDVLELHKSNRTDFHDIREILGIQASKIAVLEQVAQMEHAGLIIKTVPR